MDDDDIDDTYGSASDSKDCLWAFLGMFACLCTGLIFSVATAVMSYLFGG